MEQANVIQYEKARLPYHNGLEDKFGIDVSVWRTLIDVVWPSAKTPEGVILAWNYCKARNLDPMKKPVHIVPVWNSKLKKNVEGVWPSITELRTTATRTGQYAGCDAADFGEMQDLNAKGRVKIWKNNQETWEDKSLTIKHPEWCQITIHKIVQNRLVSFTGPKVYWMETYSKLNNFGTLPNARWERSPIYMLEKCAEAAALRRAFPEECGELTVEEMEDKIIEGEAVETPPEAPERPQAQNYEAAITYPLFDSFGNEEGVFELGEYLEGLTVFIEGAAEPDIASLWEGNEESLEQIRADNGKDATAEVSRLYNEARDHFNAGKEGG